MRLGPQYVVLTFFLRMGVISCIGGYPYSYRSGYRLLPPPSRRRFASSFRSRSQYHKVITNIRKARCARCEACSILLYSP